MQWHVDCGVAVPGILAKPDQPCVKESTIWPKALHEKQYDFVSVQPHYGSTLVQDVEAISNWMKLQPKAAFIIHSGWAFQAQRANEFASLATPDQMTHSPHYIRRWSQSYAGSSLNGRSARRSRRTCWLRSPKTWMPVARTHQVGSGPVPRPDPHDARPRQVPDAQRHAAGTRTALVLGRVREPEPRGQAVLRWSPRPVDDGAGRPTRPPTCAFDAESGDRAALVAKLSDEALRARVTALLPEIERAAKAHP